MKNSENNDKPKRTAARVEGPRSSRMKAQIFPKKSRGKALKRSSVPDEFTSLLKGQVLTQEEYVAHVSQKAYELYEKRRARTDKDDWFEAERLVKMQLLGEEQGAGSV